MVQFIVVAVVRRRSSRCTFSDRAFCRTSFWRHRSRHLQCADCPSTSDYQSGRNADPRHVGFQVVWAIVFGVFAIRIVASGRAPCGDPRWLAAYLATYRQFWRLNTLTLLEYKANFFIWLFFTFVYHGIAVGTIWVMMPRFPSMNGWNWKEVFFLYTLFMVGTRSTIRFFLRRQVPEHVHEGGFDRYLVRPLDPLFQVLSAPGQIWPDELALAFVFFASLRRRAFAVDIASDHLAGAALTGGALSISRSSLPSRRCLFG